MDHRRGGHGRADLVIVLFAVAMPRFKIMQKLVDKVNLVTREILTGLPVIRAFSTQKHEEERFDKANKDLTRTNLFVNRVMTTMMPMMMLIMNGITVLIMWNGAHGVDAGSMPGRRPNGFHAVHHADCHGFSDDFHVLHYATPRLRVRRPH